MRHGRTVLGALIGLLVGVGCLFAAPAKAGASYSWVPLTAVGQVNNSPVSVFSLGSLGFNHPFLAGDSFSFSGQCAFPRQSVCDPGFNTGNFADFYIQTSIPGRSLSILSLTINVTFNADGTLSGMTDYTDVNADFRLGGSEYAWGGVFNSDLINCNDPPGFPCLATGYWQGSPIQTIPEPSVWSLILMGIVGIGVAIKMKRRSKPRSRISAIENALN
jgi:hypothetical protein